MFQDLETEKIQREQHLSLIEAEPLIVNRFKNTTRLGANGGDGTFSLIFKSIDQTNGKEVALKFYNPLKFGDMYRFSSFYREAEILEKLKGQRDILQLVSPISELRVNTKNPVNNLEVTNVYPFFATELATTNAWEYIYSDKNSPIRNLQLFRAMCRSVQRIHSLKICHRDIKPGNYFIIGNEKFCLGDFGTARCLDGIAAPLYTRYSGWRGDKTYTAPEQSVNMKEEALLFYVGDIYSLGAILFEMFTRQILYSLIFTADFHAKLRDHFSYIPEERRRQLFGDLVPTIVEGRQLPNIDDFENCLPNFISVRINRLYKRMASLDYRKRNVTFEEIFKEINICEMILLKEAQYRRMLEWRRKRK